MLIKLCLKKSCISHAKLLIIRNRGNYFSTVNSITIPSFKIPQRLIMIIYKKSNELTKEFKYPIYLYNYIDKGKCKRSGSKEGMCIMSMLTAGKQ